MSKEFDTNKTCDHPRTFFYIKNQIFPNAASFQNWCHRREKQNEPAKWVDLESYVAQTHVGRRCL